MLIAALFTVAKTWKKCKCPSTDEWVKMYTHTQRHTLEFYSARKRDILSFATTWMDLEGKRLNENKSVRERQTPYDFTHVEYTK